MKAYTYHQKKHSAITFFKVILALTIILCFKTGYSQDIAKEIRDTLKHKRVIYKLNPAVDVPIVAGSALWCAYAGTHVYTKGPSTSAQILALSPNDVDPLDRWAIRPYDRAMDRFSYYQFYGSFALPVIFFACDPKMRSDFFKLSFLYMEALSTTGFVGYSATYFVNQYRPYAYSSSTPMPQREVQNAKNSFYAGHVEIAAVTSFFLATVYANYHPHSKIKWLGFTLAGLSTAGMGYMRLEAGMHFPSDILLGAATGTLSGILVPYFHCHKLVKNNSINVVIN